VDGCTQNYIRVVCLVFIYNAQDDDVVALLTADYDIHHKQNIQRKLL
jgi:hypothetical protein